MSVASLLEIVRFSQEVEMQSTFRESGKKIGYTDIQKCEMFSPFRIYPEIAEVNCLDETGLKIEAQ